MTNQKILEEALQKAIDGGWHKDEPAISNIADVAKEFLGTVYGIDLYPVIIFNHDFAKALWGNSEYWLLGGELGPYEAWKGHLMEMVIADNPLKYLGENI